MLRCCFLPLQLENVARHSEGKEIGGLPEGTGTGIWAGGFSESKSQESRRVNPRLGSTSRESRPFESMLGYRMSMKASTSPRLSLKKLIRTEMDAWMQSACRPNPKWGAAANKLEIKKRNVERS